LVVKCTAVISCILMFCILSTRDSLACRRQSFRRVSRKSAGGCVKNANKSSVIPYSAMVSEE